MTVRFLNDWQGYKAGMTRDLGAAVEATIPAGIAVSVPPDAKPAVQVVQDPTSKKLYGANGEEVVITGGGGSSQTARTAVQATSSVTPTDATFAVFPAQECTELEVFNDARVPIEFQRNGAGAVITLLANQRRRFVGITNANQIGFRRSDYAVPNRTQSTTISALAVTRTDTYTLAGTLSLAISGGAYAAFGNLACTSMELNNTAEHDIQFTVNNGTAYKLRHGESALIMGITNANQVRQKAVDSIARNVRPLEAECWTAGPNSATLIPARADSISADADILSGELNYPNLMPAGSILTLGNLRPVHRLRKMKGTPLARWLTTADVVTNRAADFANAANGELAFGTSIVEYTQAQTAEVTIAPLAANAAGVDVQNGSIHMTHVWPDNAGNNYLVNGPTGFYIDLFSSGTPQAPAAAYHTSPNLNALYPGFMGPSTLGYNTHRCFSLAISHFTATGGGADLASIKWARIRMTAPAPSNGCKFRPISIDFQPNALNKATVIFSFDDLHDGVWNNVLPILSKYNYPGVLCMDTTVKMGQTSFLDQERIRKLHHDYGWEVGYQVYQNETGFNLSPEDWMRAVGKWVLAMNRMGIHETQNGSYGSGAVTNIDEERLMAAKRALGSLRRFTSGQNAQFPFRCGETMPYGDPYNIRALNLSSGFTAGTIYDRLKDHLDQAVAGKGIAIYAGHTEYNAAGEHLTALTTLVETIRTMEIAGQVQVATFASVHRQAYPN